MSALEERADVVTGPTTGPTTGPATGPRHRAPVPAVRPPAPEPVRRFRSSTWWWRQAPVLAVTALSTVLHLWGSGVAPGFGEDEGTYYSQASSFLRDGLLAPYTYWYDHPPFGWMQLAPLIGLAHLLGFDGTVATGRVVMAGYAAVTGLLLYVVGRQLGLSRPAATAATALWSLSPLSTALGRQVYLDGVGLPWVLLALALVLNRRRDVFLYICAGGALAAAVLSKETLLLFLPGVVFALAQRTVRSTRVFALTGFAITFGAVGAAYPLYAATRSELLPGDDHVSLWEGVTWQLGNRSGSGWAFDPTSAAHQAVLDWSSWDAALPLAGIAAAVVCLAVRRLRPVGVLLLVPVVVGLGPTGYLPSMFITALLPFMALAVGAALEAGVRRATRPGATRAVAGVLVVAACAAALVPLWTVPWQRLLQEDDTAGYLRTLALTEQTVPADARVVVDAVLWNDLVADGRADDGWSGPVWSYKYGLDPVAAAAAGVDGPEDVDYVVASGALLGAAEQSPRLQELLERSVPVAVTTDGVEIRKVER